MPLEAREPEEFDAKFEAEERLLELVEKLFEIGALW